MTLPPINFDAVLHACPLCSSENLREYDRTFEDLKIDRCDNCGSKFMNPQCSDEYLTAYYLNYDHVLPEDQVNSGPNDPRVIRRRRAKTQTLDMIDKFTSPGRFLSVGCGDGMELEVARERGWEVEGFEVDPDITKRVSKRLGVPIYTGNFCHLGLPAKSYDCVYLDQVLEHLKNPQEYLWEANRLLKKGGLLFIGCPNITSLSNAWKTISGRVGLQRRHGRHYDLCKHMFYFSPGVLTSVVQDYFHFEVLICEGAPLSGIRTTEQSVWGHIKESMIRKYPVLDSTFHFVARKLEDCAPSQSKTRAAA